jgi:hypothetical protein
MVDDTRRALDFFLIIYDTFTREENIIMWQEIFHGMLNKYISLFYVCLFIWQLTATFFCVLFNSD